MRFFFIAGVLGNVTTAGIMERAEDFEDILREDGSSIHYYLQKYERDSDRIVGAPKRLLLLIQGSGCAPISQQSETMQKLASVLPESNQLWVEKRGLEGHSAEAIVDFEACSSSYYQHESLFQRVSDYRDVLKKLAVYYYEVIVLGGSEGAIIAGLLRQENLPITAMIALNGGGQYFIDDILWNIEKTVPEPYRTEALVGIRDFMEQAQQMSDRELDENRDNASNHSLRWWSEMFSLDMDFIWKKGDIPLLMIQTLGDDNVSVSSAMALFESLESYSHIETKFFPELDHGFKNRDGVSEIEAIITHIQSWLQGI